MCSFVYEIQSQHLLLDICHARVPLRANQYRKSIPYVTLYLLRL